MRISLLSLFACLFSAVTLVAQDARFSQFYKTPMQLNPALSGVFDGRYRVQVNYRSLYSSLLSEQSFRTYHASYEYRMQSGSEDYFALHGTALYDAVGAASFERLNLMGGGAYHKQLGGGRYAQATHYLGVGAQFGLGQYGINSSELWFFNQYDAQRQQIDRDLPSGEALDGSMNTVFLDLAAGLLWYAVFDEQNSIFVGLAMHHLSTPNIAMLPGQEDLLDPRYVAHMGAAIGISRELTLLPRAAVQMQGSALSLSAGLNVRYSNNDWKELKLRAGAWPHMVNTGEQGVGIDAVVFATIFEFEKWNLGLSYDATVSALRRSNYARGAFEISLTFLQPGNFGRSKVTCPTY